MLHSFFVGFHPEDLHVAHSRGDLRSLGLVQQISQLLEASCQQVQYLLFLQNIKILHVTSRQQVQYF